MPRLIRASEVGEYVFCHRAWWLRSIEGRTPDTDRRLEMGSAQHRAYGRQVAVSRALLIAGLLLLVVSLAGLLLGG